MRSDHLERWADQGGWYQRWRARRRAPQPLNPLTCATCCADLGLHQPGGEPGVGYYCPTCQCEWSPATEDDTCDLNCVAGSILADYQRAVTQGATRHELAMILTGLAGCELTLSYTDTGASREHHTAGLLLLEVAYAAEEGAAHHGERIRWAEFRAEPVVAALRNLAFAYAANTPEGPGSIGQCLDDLADVMPVEVLVPLMRAHGHEFQARWRQRGEDGAW